MTSQERFENFYNALQKSSPIWFDGLELVFPGKDIKEGVKKAWIQLHADGTLKPPVDWKACRNLVNKTLTWQDPKSSDGFEKAVPVEIHPQALTGEARLARLKEWQAAVAKIGNPETERSDRYEQIRNAYKVPAGEEYRPPSNLDEIARIEDLKVQYGRLHTDKITGKKLEGSPTFDQWKETQI